MPNDEFRNRPPVSENLRRLNRLPVESGNRNSPANGWVLISGEVAIPGPLNYVHRLMNEHNATKLVPGQQVRVVQQIAARDHTWTSDVRGTVIDYSQKQTGSWYAHSKDDKLWLDRLTLRKLDGELITLNLDEYSVVEIEPAAA